ncbi:UbiH/UbiF family hydroxylase [Mesorhizobium xinjiangense]|uniref:UbiH/UbiF family hydroxylase n=1 Tax=Mesorhizobium xinjiangense TaxID=2678685 RepID=UPI0012EEBB15|nr:UbiH/UbiF family hydroxylase [Mesorhizobium xinjiangense]
MGKSERTDILVAGTGPAGLMAALAFADAGFAVHLVGPAVRTDDARTTALMAPSLRFLTEIGIAQHLIAEGAPLRTMQIVDATRRLVRSRPVRFSANEIGEEAFGYNIPNTVLHRELEAAVKDRSAISWTQGFVERWHISQDGIAAETDRQVRIEAQLAVAADGRNSSAREATGITVFRRSLPQAALVLNFSHEADHQFVSTEFHTETGPFTQVPLPGRRSSLVWVLSPQTAEAHAALPDERLSRLIEEQMQSMLGRVTVEGPCQVYPLTSALPATFARNRIALVGEAAHVFPPIGAQGLNLGIRDIKDLVTVCSARREDPGADRALADYSRRRRPDILARSGAVNALNASLLSDFLPAQLARSIGLEALSALAPLRGFFMREGLQPGSGFAHALSRGREQVRR